MAGRIAFIPLRSSIPLSDERPALGEFVIEPTVPHKAYWKRHDTGVMEKIVNINNIISEINDSGVALNLVSYENVTNALVSGETIVLDAGQF